MKIQLQSGPYHGRAIEDSGKVVIRMGIAKHWSGNRPAQNTEVGCAHYEPDKLRENAHWLKNEWEGKCEGIY